MNERTLEERLKADHKKALANPSPQRQRELDELYKSGKGTWSMGSDGSVTTKPKRWTWDGGGS